ITVCGQTLEDQARRDRQLVERMEQHRDAPTAAITVVDRFPDAAIRLDRIYETGQMMVVADEARGRGRADRQIDCPSDRAAFIAMLDVLKGCVSGALKHPELRLACYIAHRPGLRPRAKQGALWAAKHLET